MCQSYLFYCGDGDNKEEGQAAGDWAGGGVDDKLRGKRTNRSEGEMGAVEERTTGRGGGKIRSQTKLRLDDVARKIPKRESDFVSML